jgi:predicted O-linked N-acetylglucosamine transferase (SPINDLY family)
MQQAPVPERHDPRPFDAHAGAGTAAAFQQAVRLQQQGCGLEAEALCSQVLQAEPLHFAAWHLKGLLALERGEVETGIELIGRSLTIKGDQPEALSNIGNALLTRRRTREALTYFENALQLRPDFANAHFNRGVALRDLGKAPEALACFDRVLALRPRDVRALCDRASTLCDLERPDEALAALDRLLSRQPDSTDGLKGRGATLLTLGRPAEALESYEHAARLAAHDADAHYGRGNAFFRLERAVEAVAAYDHALSLKNDFPEALGNRSVALCALKRPAEALASCDEALRLNPSFATAHFSRGNALQDLGRYRDAVESYDKAVSLCPEHSDALTNSGAALSKLGEHAAALARFDRALAVNPRHVAALTNQAHTLSRLRRHAEAGEAAAKVLELSPGNDSALGFLMASRLHCADWRDWSGHSASIVERVRAGQPVSRPMDFLTVSDDAEAQLRCARIAAAAKMSVTSPPLWKGERYGHERIRLAYVSGNFGQHPVSRLLAGVLEAHDPSRFDLVGISLGDDASPLAQRIRSAFPRYIDVSAKDDREIAVLLRQLEIDIAIDLHGFTEGMRAALFASRPAPVQVNYLGYPGTLGSSHWDYILADAVVVPPGEERWYAEQVVRLPQCYLPNDDRRAIAEAPDRVHAGLPAEGMVFCAFTSPYKINPPVFDIWMRLLREVPRSVLWLRQWAELPMRNLLREAERRGVAAERLVFAEELGSAAEHLGRQRLADLVLDTLPYNAHSTACEALWSGVPVLTCLGGGFAARVAASALRAVGMEELITTTLGDYERRALELAREPAKLAALKQKLAANRMRSPLFDTERYCRQLERAFTGMWERAERGEAPQGFSVEPVADAPTRLRAAQSGPQPAEDALLLARARTYLEQGEPALAETLLRRVLASEPRHRDALHALGVLCLQTQRPEEGCDLIRESLRVDPEQVAAHMHLGIALRRLDRLTEAIDSFDLALRVQPDSAEVLYNRGNTLADLGCLAEAVADFQSALRLKPALIVALARLSELFRRLDRHEEALSCSRQIVERVADDDSADPELTRLRANALTELGRSAEALTAFDRALRLQPGSADLWNERGIVLRDLQRLPEALESLARALRLRPDFAEAFTNQGDALRDAARFADALSSYDQALRLKPALGAAHRGRGLSLRGLRRPAEALVEFDHAERLNAPRLDLFNQRGNVLWDLRRFEEALACYEQALALLPDHPTLLWNRASALRRLKRYAEATRCLAHLDRVAPRYEFAPGLLLHCRLELCDWGGYAQMRERVLTGLGPGVRIAEPFTLLTLSDAAAAQLECARAFAATTIPKAGLLPPVRGHGHRRIRLAYVSGDLREHAVAYLMAGVFERHDRERFETIALSLQAQEDSAMGRRLQSAFDRFIDVSDRCDHEIAALMRELEVDIAVDLMGYTEHQRCAVFAHRPAAVQVNYLGYPGTMGADFMDYILADEFVIPPQLRHHYAEQVVYLPDCFQANDDRRSADARPRRTALGLPESGLVFCCFNVNAKLNPAMLDIWCRLLQAVPGSVLWLVARSLEVCANLEREAAQRGVDPQRLVFAGLKLYPQHLARLGLADLFLDTFPFSAGASASDALWAGVPLLTCAGEAYASRMAGSLLHSLGLPELVATTLEDYERRALELARAPESLAVLRRRLQESRLGRATFDTTRFCRGLERAYLTMWERAERGEAPQGFSVSGGEPRA